MAVRFKRLNQRVVVITGASVIGLVTARAAAERAHGWPCISQPRRIAIVKRGNYREAARKRYQLAVNLSLCVTGDKLDSGSPPSCPE
jgi:NAD(P)-dependent dehydrogenase (short-subunit alcohol dehydrogenase family)